LGISEIGQFAQLKFFNFLGEFFCSENLIFDAQSTFSSNKKMSEEEDKTSSSSNSKLNLFL
jgi:hypothetical protein